MKTVSGTHSGSPNHDHRKADSLAVAEKISKNYVRILLPVAICALAAFPGSRVAAQTPAPEAPRQQLKGHLTAEMINAPLAGRVAPTTHLTLTVGLVIGNRADLINAVSQISNPASPSYRQYLTPEQFADQFGATPADYQSVLDWAQSNNLTPETHQNRFVVTVQGAVADIESALNVHLNYHARSDGTLFFAPDAEPALKLSVPVEHIGGLNDFVRPESAGGSAAGGNYQGNDFRNAYASGMTLTGAGQKIGIFMLDGFAQSDIDGYAKQVGETFLPVQVIPSDATLTPGTEGTLDIEAAYSMAPAAQVVAFVGTSNRTAMLTNMTDNKDIKQFSSSWFWYDGNTTDENLMLQLASQGQSFFQASGDGGAYAPGTFASCPSGSMDDRTFPAITIVGGTDLHMSGSGTDYGTLETAWVHSSGGYIPCETIPPYQFPIAGQNGASAAYRNAPDVSAQANDIAIFYKGSSENVGGTSEATPLWAGYMALVNELAANYGSPSVGFANPALYLLEIAAPANFHDVVSGCNPDKSGDQYCAGTGYDLVTGLGTPTNTLIYSLSGAQVFPLYCQGPLKTASDLTPFKWASTGAGAANPGPGECAWADRAPRGTEIKSGDSNVISGPLGKVANLPAGKFAEIGVYNDQTTNDMVVTQIVGLVSPPFSSSPTLP